jgi:hypothetical protein
VQVPTLFVTANADMAPPSHDVQVLRLLDGGLRDGGWMGEGRRKGGHALAILPAWPTTTSASCRCSRCLSSPSSTSSQAQLNGS